MFSNNFKNRIWKNKIKNKIDFILFWTYLKFGHMTSDLTCQPDTKQDFWTADSPGQNRTVDNLTHDHQRRMI